MVLLLQAAAQWREAHGALPSGSKQQSEFKATVRAMQRSRDGLPLEVRLLVFAMVFAMVYTTRYWVERLVNALSTGGQRARGGVQCQQALGIIWHTCACVLLCCGAFLWFA